MQIYVHKICILQKYIIYISASSLYYYKKIKKKPALTEYTEYMFKVN